LFDLDFSLGINILCNH